MGALEAGGGAGGYPPKGVAQFYRPEGKEWVQRPTYLGNQAAWSHGDVGIVVWGATRQRCSVCVSCSITSTEGFGGLEA
jgi:hypothetical protein